MMIFQETSSVTIYVRQQEGKKMPKKGKIKGSLHLGNKTKNEAGIPPADEPTDQPTTLIHDVSSKPHRLLEPGDSFHEHLSCEQSKSVQSMKVV